MKTGSVSTNARLGIITRPASQLVLAAEIQQEHCLGAKIVRRFREGAVPLVRVCIVIGPTIRQADRLKRAIGEIQSKGRVGVEHVTRRVVAAPAGVSAVLQEVDVVPHPGEPQDVLQVVPRQPPDRPPDDVAENDDSHSSRPPMVVSDR